MKVMVFVFTATLPLIIIPIVIVIVAIFCVVLLIVVLRCRQSSRYDVRHINSSDLYSTFYHGVLALNY